jgi:hypothetical protein
MLTLFSRACAGNGKESLLAPGQSQHVTFFAGSPYPHNRLSSYVRPEKRGLPLPDYGRVADDPGIKEA